MDNKLKKLLTLLEIFCITIGIVSSIYLLIILGKEALLTSLLFYLAGFLVYWFYGRVASQREYALMHVIERITDKELTTHSLESELKEVIREREEESSTALTPFIAIPHIVVKGEHSFDILLARCKEGIHFSDAAPSVHALFVLTGSKDERNFHLRSLAAIAQIVHGPCFEKN